MEITPTSIPDVLLITPARHGDHRGFFSETWSRPRYEEAGISCEWIQDNHSMSATPGVLRGLHYQIHPAAQNKLVRVTRGRILDVAVDIRRESPTFGQHVTAELSAENWQQIYVPVGFAHGFVTLEPDTEVLYKVDAPWAPDCERGIAWNDPALGIDWGIAPDAAVLSAKDEVHPTLAETTDLF